MGQKQEKYLDSSGILWDKLSGKKIILAGVSDRRKESFRQSLTYKSSQMGGAFEVSDDLAEAGEEDYVFLFSSMENISEMDSLLEQLKILAQKKAASAVLVSDNRVYGKVFGADHKLPEHELGYACHTSAGDQAVTAMRMAEHLAYRMAMEGAPVRIVRMDHVPDSDTMRPGCGGKAEDKPDCDAMRPGAGDQRGSAVLPAVVEAAVKVLLLGVPGEVYNLPVQAKEEVGEQSPLSPVRVETDASKLESAVHQTSSFQENG